MIHRQGRWLVVALIAVAVAGTLAVAQAAIDTPATGSANDEPFLTPDQRAQLRERFRGRRGRMELRHRGLELTDRVHAAAVDPTVSAILHMRRIERFYREQHDLDGLRAFYEDVLTRTDNLAIRNVAGLKLSELLAQGEDIDGALAVLERGLEENLRNAE